MKRNGNGDAVLCSCALRWQKSDLLGAGKALKFQGSTGAAITAALHHTVINNVINGKFFAGRIVNNTCNLLQGYEKNGSFH